MSDRTFDEVNWEPVPVEVKPEVIEDTLSFMFQQTTDTPLAFIASVTPHLLTFSPCGITVNCKTGEVTIPPELNLTDAARAFWDMVGRVTGQKIGFD